MDRLLRLPGVDRNLRRANCPGRRMALIRYRLTCPMAIAVWHPGAGPGRGYFCRFSLVQHACFDTNKPYWRAIA